MASNIVSGARALVTISEPGKEDTKAIFTNISYGITYDVQPAYVLGRYTAAAIDYTAVEVVNITASGWRVVGIGGWHTLGKLPTIQELLTAGYINMTIVDRATGNVISRIKDCRATGVSGGFSSRQLSESTYSFVGILVEDENSGDSEAPSAVIIPGYV